MDETWTRVGRDLLPRTILLVAAIALGGALLLGTPVGALIRLVTGVDSWLLGFAAGAGLLGILAGPILLRRTPRAVDVDPRRGLLRIGGRVVPASELRRAWRTATPTRRGLEARLRLELPGAVDPVLVLSSELGAQGLRAVRDVIAQAPLELAPGAFPVPPVGDELGERSSDRVPDLLSLLLMDSVEAGYRKPTLLAELELAIAGERRPSPTDPLSALRAEMGGLVERPGPPAIPEPPHDPEIRVSLFSLAGRRFRARRDAVEAWIAQASGGDGTPPPRARSRLGLAMMIVGLALGPASLLLVIADAALRFTGVLDPLDRLLYPIAPGLVAISWLLPMILFVVSLLLVGPALVVVGALTWWDAALRRLDVARDAAVMIAARGVRIPRGVATLLQPGASLGRVQFAQSFGWAIAGVLLLAVGLTFVAVSNGASDELAPDVWMSPLGIALVILSAPVFVHYYRVFAEQGPLRLRRAGLEAAVLRLSAGISEPVGR